MKLNQIQYPKSYLSKVTPQNLCLFVILAKMKPQHLRKAPQKMGHPVPEYMVVTPSPSAGLSSAVNQQPFIKLTQTKSQTSITRCWHIFKTVNNVTVANLELAFTRYRQSLKTMENSTVTNSVESLQEFDAIYLHLRSRLASF